MTTPIQNTTPRQRWGRYRGGYWANVMMLWVGRNCLWLGYFFGWFGAAYFYLVARQAREASMTYLDHLRPGRGRLSRWWHTYRHMEMFSRLLLDRAIALQSRAIGAGGIHVEGVGQQNLAALSEGGLILAAHFGNADIGIPYIREFGPNRPLHLVMHVDPAEATEQFHQRYRAAFKGYDVINTTDPLTAGVKIIEALSTGGIVAMRADRTLTGRAVRVRFLGQEANLPAGPFVAAVLSGKPVVQVTITRLATRRYECHVGPPRRYGRDDCSGTREACIQRAADDFARDIEVMVGKHPLQWGNFYDYWLNRELPRKAR